VVSINKISEAATPKKRKEKIVTKKIVCSTIDSGDPIQWVIFLEKSSNFWRIKLCIISLQVYDIIHIMETQSKTTTKDFFINLGAIVVLYVSVGSLLNLLFTIINHAFPKITEGYNYYSNSISMPVAILIICFPLLILLMWMLSRDYVMNPEKKNSWIHRFLTYLTVFIAGGVVAGDLVTVIYFFIDGQELTTAFLLKFLAVLVVVGSVFAYFISDLKGKLTGRTRNLWRIFALVIVLGSIVLGFSVLGSPRTQRLYKYDDQKVNDLMNVNNEVMNYYSINGKLPKSLTELSLNYFIPLNDSQTQKPYEYEKTSELTFKLCAEFNKDSLGLKDSNTRPMGYQSWIHTAGRHCFDQTINPNMYSKPILKY